MKKKTYEIYKYFAKIKRNLIQRKITKQPHATDEKARLQ